MYIVDFSIEHSDFPWNIHFPMSYFIITYQLSRQLAAALGERAEAAPGTWDQF